MVLVVITPVLYSAAQTMVYGSLCVANLVHAISSTCDSTEVYFSVQGTYELPVEL